MLENKNMCRRGTISGLVCCVCVAFVIGCGKVDPRVEVSGSVTLNGKALSGGIINFQPERGDKSGSAGAGLENGSFKIPAEKGLLPGDYRVIVQAFEETDRMVEDLQLGKIRETVMIRFQEEKTLRATVSKEGENRFDFQITRAIPVR